MKLLIPIVMLLAGVCGGVGAGLVLRPAAEPSASAPTASAGNDAGEGVPSESSDSHSRSDSHAGTGTGDASGLEYIKLNNQFVVPIVTKDSVDAVIVMSLSLEVAAGESEIVYMREPKLRDAFLRVLFDHANMGGFDGAFTERSTLDVLRKGLLSVARDTLGHIVTAILITDIARQNL